MNILDVQNIGKTTVFTINRPEKMNSINRELAHELQNKFAEFDRSEQRVAIITGAGTKAFCTGADLSDIPEFWRCMPTIGLKTDKPIICAVRGWCVGGGLAMVALSDLCVAAQDARFRYPEAKIGFTGGMMATLATRIPHKVAMEIMLLGRELTAKRAMEVGLINEVVLPGEELNTALAMAQELEVLAPLVLKTLKKLVVDYTLQRTPAELMGLTQQYLDVVQSSEDVLEGTAAFRENRPANFKGR